jgi:hypothetical protein
MKTERVVLLTTPEFKAFLAIEAEREGVSVAELVRSRCSRKPDGDEAVLGALAAELRRAVAAARKSLQAGLADAESALADLKAKAAPATATKRKRASERLAA